MSDYQNFTSLPPDEERTFVVYEQYSRESGKKAMTIGMIAAGIFFVLTLIVVFSHSKPTESKIKKEDIQTSTTADDAPDTAEAEPDKDAKKDDEESDDEESEDDEDDASETKKDDDAEKGEAKKGEVKKDDAKAKKDEKADNKKK